MDDPLEWRFFLNYPPGNGNINNAVTGFLTNGRDSLSLGYIYSDILKRNKKDPSDEKIMMRSIRGYSLVDFENRQVAALVFKQSSSYIGARKLDNFTGGELALIGRDNSKPTRLAIATLFAIMLGVQ